MEAWLAELFILGLVSLAKAMFSGKRVDKRPRR